MRIFLLLTTAVLSSAAAFAGIAITEPRDGATVPLLVDFVFSPLRDIRLCGS